MKNPNYTYQELVHHLDLYSTDPLVRRLIDFIVEGKNDVLSGLIDAGMDPVSREFNIDDVYLTPGEYIEHLHKARQSAEDELYLAQAELADTIDERDQLKTRSVAELMASMEELVKRANADAAEARRIAQKTEQENEELKDKINVWKIMES